MLVKSFLRMSALLGKDYFHHFSCIAGPCAAESADHCLFMVRALQKIFSRHQCPWIFKTSFDKANRTSLSSQRGLGFTETMKVFEIIKKDYAVPIITDVHNVQQCEDVAPYVDVLQIPAFLCRQTDLLVAAGRTGKIVHIKKGQFLNPHAMRYALEKTQSSGASLTLLGERGTFFGYSDLVVDMRSLAIMHSFGAPVVFDATHSVQNPGSQKTGGQREFIEVLARAALATGKVSCLFFETHDRPEHAISDGPNMIPLSHVDQFLGNILPLVQNARRPYVPMSA